MNQLQETIESAQKNAYRAAEGWETVVWCSGFEDLLTKVYGFNFQKVGEFREGQVLKGAWAGCPQVGSTCKVMKII